jgi:hypothetical protein
LVVPRALEATEVKVDQHATSLTAPFCAVSGANRRSRADGARDSSLLFLFSGVFHR